MSANTYIFLQILSYQFLGFHGPIIVKTPVQIATLFGSLYMTSTRSQKYTTASPPQVFKAQLPIAQHNNIVSI